MNLFQKFLNELAEALQFSSLQPDEAGACLILLRENQAELLFELDEQLVPGTILLSSPLTLIPSQNRIEIYEECLKGNRLLDETLSCKPDEDILYLHRRLNPDIRSENLKHVIVDFLTQLTQWRKKVDELSKRAPKAYRFPLPPEQFQLPPFETK